jgi:hypothetical protein
MCLKKWFFVGVAISTLVLLSDIQPTGAYPFIEVEGYVNPDPFGSTVTDNGDGTSTFSQVDYRFTVVSADYGSEMDFLSLEFESDVFISPGTLYGIDPSNWLTMAVTSLSGSTYQLASAGTTIGAGESLLFSMLDVIIYNAALTDNSYWQEGQVWGQSWVAGDTHPFGVGDGGSTAVPEPGSLMLLGAGLLALGTWRVWIVAADRR